MDFEFEYELRALNHEFGVLSKEFRVIPYQYRDSTMNLEYPLLSSVLICGHEYTEHP